MLEQLKKHSFFTKLEKYQFYYYKVYFLDFIVLA